MRTISLILIFVFANKVCFISLFKEEIFNSSVKRDLKSALNSISSNNPLFITGSLYLMGEVLKLHSVKELDF